MPFRSKTTWTKFYPILGLANIGTWHFGKKIFGTDILSQEHFGKGTFWLCGHSGTWTFCLRGRFGMKTFWHRDFLAWGRFNKRGILEKDISAQEYFGTWTFGHWEISAPYKAIWTFRHRHFGTCAEMFYCAKINVSVLKCPCSEKYLCWKAHMPNSLLAKTSMETKRPCAETSMEMKWFLPK